jgi:ATP-dependent DNA helicase DinG
VGTHRNVTISVSLRFGVSRNKGCFSVTLDSRQVLGDGGHVARRLGAYESRPQELEMAAAVEHAIEAGEHLIVEAGTGTGKSFAYLVPAILAATKGQGEGLSLIHI